MEYGIAEAAERTGVAERTLRAWEQRHGFPSPRRLPGGHRRYSEGDLEIVRRVALERAGGATLAAAIARAGRELPQASEASIFASLRRRHPELQPRVMPKHLILALSRAIEDESLARAEAPLLFGSFQRERFFRAEEARWRELALAARQTVIFADFPRLQSSSDGLVELPVAPTHPIAREWAVVCDAPSYGACLTGRAPLTGPVGEDRRSHFDVIWTVEPAAVRDAARTCAAIAGESSPQLREAMQARLDSPTAPVGSEHLRLATAITARMIDSLA